MNLTLITGNQHKAAQLSEWLHHPLAYLKLELDEIQTTNSEELITHKVKQAFQKIQTPVLVEDTSLQFNAFGKLPGPFIKFFEKELGLEKCCRLLDAFETRLAECSTTYGLTLDGNTVNIFTGTVTGQIALHPAGTGGFGWDALFIPEGYTKTRAELSPQEYEKTSPRQRAVALLAAYIEKNL